MALLKIARMGHPVLLRRAEPIEDPAAPEIRRLAADMIETMRDAPGIGLAGPQVHVPLRIFVIELPATRNGGEALGPRVLINPEITPLGPDMVMRVEGCLSIPGLRGTVPRFLRVHYRAVDCDGAVLEGEADGLHANVLQHENDHLDGILYPMRVTDFASFGFADEMNRFAQENAA